MKNGVPQNPKIYNFFHENYSIHPKQTKLNIGEQWVESIIFIHFWLPWLLILVAMVTKLLLMEDQQ